MPALAIYDESSIGHDYFDFVVNSLIANPYLFAGGSAEGPQNQGGYNGAIVYTLKDTIFLQTLFYPEVNFNLNPFWKNNASWWSGTKPVGFTQLKDQWGDGGAVVKRKLLKWMAGIFRISSETAISINTMSLRGHSPGHVSVQILSMNCLSSTMPQKV